MSGDGETGGGEVGNELGIPGLADLSRCGVGSSSTVYRARDLRHGRTVAVKVLSTGKVSADVEPAFERELAAMGRLSTHPNIIDLYGSGTTDDRHPYIIMPYYERGNYADLVDDSGPITWEEAVDFGVKIAGALHTAHARGFVHRDVKPANIFRGEFERQPILADFGIASFATPGLGGSFTVKVSTTPLYGAPEVLEGDRPTERSDLYSFGATLFALVEGAPAFVDPSTEVVVHRVTAAKAAPRPTQSIPDALADLIGEMMARRPESRPVSGLEVAHRLVAVQKDAGLDPTPIIADTDTESDTNTESDIDNESDTDTDAGDAAPEAAPVRDRRPAAPAVPDPVPTPARSKPVIEPIAVRDPGPGPRSTRPVGSLERPTEPVTEPPAPRRPGRAGQPRRRPGLRWAVLGTAVLLVAAGAYMILLGSGPAPGELIERDVDDSAAAEVLAAWADVGAPMAAWTAHPSAWVTDVEFAPGGGELATAGTDGRLGIWRPPYPVDADGGPAGAVEFADWVIDVDWSPAGDRLAVGMTDGRLAVAPAEGTPPTVLATGSASVEAVAWSPDGEQVLAGYARGGLGPRPVDVADEAATGAAFVGHEADILAADWSPSGDRVVSAAKDGRVILWDAEVAESVAVIESPDGRWTRSVLWVAATLVLTTAEDGTVTLLSVAPGEAAPEELSNIAIGSTVLAADLWLDHSVLLAAGYEDGAVRVWDLVTGDEVVELAPPAADDGADATAVSWSDDGRTLAVGRLDGTVEVWSIG